MTSLLTFIPEIIFIFYSLLFKFLITPPLGWEHSGWKRLFLFISLPPGELLNFSKKEFTFASISLIFFISIIFVAHRDIIRYLLPAVPFLLLSYRDNLTKKEFYLILVLIIIPIYLFSLNFISQNKMPIADWGPLL